MKEFVNAEKDYLDWIKNNPNGYVLNSKQNLSKSYLPLHRSTCYTISDPKVTALGNSFTGKQYKKLCFETLQDLADWMIHNHPYSELCSKCSPNVYASARQYQVAFEQSLANYFNNPEAREQQLQNAPTAPQQYSITTTVYKRNLAVVAARLAIANGICDDCKQNGPFITRVTGNFFLEVHHIAPLSNGGLDTLENTVALCPNCHRKRHYE